MMIPGQADEQSIIRRCLKGDSGTYAVLVNRYQGMAYNLAYRMVGDESTAEDIAQDAFIAAYTGLREFRFGSKFSSWLYSIVLNKCRDHLRRRRETVPAEDIADHRPWDGISPEQAASAGQSSDILQQALEELPPDYREVLVLKHIDELDYEEISSITGDGVPALKVRAHRGREMLRRILEKAGVTHG